MNVKGAMYAQLMQGVTIMEAVILVHVRMALAVMESSVKVSFITSKYHFSFILKNLINL